MSPTASARCVFCGKGPFPTHAGLNKHIQRASACREASKEELGQYIANIWQDSEYNPHTSVEHSHTRDTTPSSLDDPSTEHPDPAILDADINAAGEYIPAFTFNTSIRQTADETPDDGIPGPLPHNSIPGNTCFIETYPAEAKAGAAWGTGTPKFEAIRKEQEDVGKDWGPFKDEDEWRLAEWLIKNVGQTQTDKFLKLPIVSRFL